MGLFVVEPEAGTALTIRIRRRTDNPLLTDSQTFHGTLYFAVGMQC